MSAAACRIQPKRSKRYTTKQQYKIIDEFLLKHPKLLNRIWTKTLNGHQRLEVNKLWAILKNRLNARGPPERNLDGWRTVLVQRRHQLKRYAKHTDALNKTSCCSNGDGIFGIKEEVPETSQNDRTMSTISQDLPRGLRKMRSIPKPSKQQLEHLDEFILKHPNLDYILKKQRYQWKLLRDRLNNRGPARSSREWSTLWKMRKELAQNMETQKETSCAALQPALQIRMEPPEFCVKIYNNNDGLFDIIEPNLAKEASPNDNNMTTTSTISQDDLHIKNELDEENVHEDSHELDEKNVHGDFHELDEENVHGDFQELDDENNTHEEFHPTNSDEFQTQPQPEQQCQKCRCCCSSRTRSNELFEKQFEMQTKFMQNLTEQREHFHIEIIKILEENNKLLKENLRQKKEENDAREVRAEELRLKKIELKIMKAINDVKLKKLNL